MSNWVALLFNCTACARGVCCCARFVVAGYGLRVNAWRVVLPVLIANAVSFHLLAVRVG